MKPARHLLWVLTGLALVACVVVLGTRLRANEALRATIEAVASDNAGMAIEVGQVRGAWWSGLTLHEVKVHGTPDPKSEVIASAPLIQASYDLLGLVGGAPRPIRLDVYHPTVAIKVGPDRLMNLSPRLRAVHDDPPGEPAPPVDFVIHGGEASYGDASARKPFEVAVERLTGTGRIRGFDLVLDLQAMRDADVLRAGVRYDLAHMRGALDLTAEGLHVPYWVNRFGWAPEYSLLEGTADLEAHAAWRDPLMMDELKLWGTAKLHGGKAWLKNTEVPLTDLAGTIAFDQDTARFQGLEAKLAGMPLRFGGKLTGLVAPVPYLGYQDPVYAMTVTAPAIDLAKLHEAWPGVRSIGLGGAGRLDAEVSGRVSDPVVKMVGRVPVGRWGKETLTDVRLDATYVPGRFDVPGIRGRLNGGVLAGRAHVGLPERGDLPYAVDLAFDGVKLPPLVAHYMEEPPIFAVDGRVHGRYALRGAGARSRATLDARLEGGTIDAKPVQACTLGWSSEGGRWAIPGWRLKWGGTEAVFALAGREGGPFELKFELPRGDLADLVALNPSPPRTPIAGLVTGRGAIRGDFARPLTWTGDVAFDLPRGTVWAEPFEGGSVKGHFHENLLVLDEMKARFLRGAVTADGTYGPVVAKRSVEAFTRLDVKLADWQLGAIGALPPDWKALQGRVQGRFAYVGRAAGYDATGWVRAARVRHPGWGELEDLRASMVLTPADVTLAPLTWTQRGEAVRVAGSVTTPEAGDPVLDLRVTTDKADVATLLSAVKWPAVMDRLSPRDVARAGAIGPLTVAGELPGETKAAIGPATGPILGALGEQLARFQAYGKAPVTQRAASTATVPFWEEAAGRLSLDARLTGPATHPRADVAATAEGLKVAGRTLEEVTLEATATAERLKIGIARVREAGRTVLTLAGALSDGPADTLVVRAHGLDLGWLDRALGPKRMKLAGQADGVFRLRGPRAAPRVEAEGTLRAGTFAAPGIQPMAFDAIDADVAFERGRLWLHKATVRQGGHEASIAGSLPVDERARGPAARLDLALSLSDGNLGILNLVGQDRFRWLGGKGTIAMQVHGTMAKPSLAGRIDLKEGRFEARGLDGPVEGFAADVALDDDKIAIKALEGRYGGGGFELAGDVFWEQFEPRRLDLTARARPFRVRTPDGTFAGMVEADVKLRGAVSSPVLSGQVSAWDGVVRIRDKMARESAPPKLPPLKLAGLEVTLGPSLYVRNAMMDVSVTTLQRQGHLRVDGTLDAPSPRGVVIVESGTITPLNNPFKIVEGRVEFVGENPGASDVMAEILGGEDAAPVLNGKIDVTARTGVYDYTENETVDVTAHVTGTLDRMDMRFTALPMRSEQQVLDILSKKQVLAGTFSGKLDRGEVIVKEVGGFVTSNLEELAAPLTLRLRNMLNLQTLRFELVSNYEKTSLSDLAGFRPALTMETRPLFERLSLGSRLVAGEFYDTSPNTGNDSTYASLNLRLNRRLAVEYRVDPYVSPRNERIFNQTLGLRAQVAF